jgi:hypothetical protein
MAPTERVGRAALSGVWMQHGDLRTLGARGFLIGADLVIKWSTVEPNDGVFDWSSVTSELAQADGAEFFMQAALQTGPDAPRWIYTRAPPAASVPLVHVTPDPGHEEDVFPYYLDGTYRALFLRVQRAFADYLAHLPARLRRRIVSGQAMYGTTGDDVPWHGAPLDVSFDISWAQWNNFTQSLGPAVCATFAGNSTVERLQVLWNSDTAGLEYFMGMCPGSLIKTGSASHGYQINFELEEYATKGAWCHVEGVNCRGEEWPFSNTGGYLEAPAWGEYWHLLALLWFGTDRPGLSQPALDDPANLPAYEVFNRYAGSIRPPAAAWAGAIIALRDGLDAADTARFPEALFGSALQANTSRNAAIASAFAARGAAQGDATAATRPPLGSRSPMSLNDVGWRVSAGNWGNGLAVQLAPDETSVGWWRVGPRAAPYGRFARGFQVASGRTAMSFVLDARLWGGLPLPAARNVALRLRLVYFDAGGGALTLAYDAAGGCTTAVAVPVAAAAVVLVPWAKVPFAEAPVVPGAWAEISINITDGYFGRRCGPRGADIVLSATADTIVHGFEVYGTVGPTATADSTSSATATASATRTASSTVTATQTAVPQLPVAAPSASPAPGTTTSHGALVFTTSDGGGVDTTAFTGDGALSAFANAIATALFGALFPGATFTASGGFVTVAEKSCGTSCGSLAILSLTDAATGVAIFTVANPAARRLGGAPGSAGVTCDFDVQLPASAPAAAVAGIAAALQPAGSGATAFAAAVVAQVQASPSSALAASFASVAAAVAAPSIASRSPSPAAKATIEVVQIAAAAGGAAAALFVTSVAGLLLWRKRARESAVRAVHDQASGDRAMRL